MTSMEIGVKLREVFTGIKEKHPSQQALAMAWYEGHGDKKLSAATVESRLSELFNGKLDGVKFFFGQRDRSTVLLRLLGISPSEAEQIYAGAELALAGQLDARTLIDLRAMTDAEVQLACKWIESEVLLHAGLLPMVLLVLPGQAKQIPRGFDDYRDKDHLTWTEEVGKAAERATVLMAPTPWALGPDRQVWPWQKWAQFVVLKGKVQLDPPDALDQLATSGALAGPPLVEHELATLGAEPDRPGAEKWLKGQGICWRSAAERLLACTELQLVKDVSPAVRMALGASVGLAVGATGQEVVEHEIEVLAAKIKATKLEKWSESELKNRLKRARLRPQLPVVARVGDMLHAINWPGCTGRKSGERLAIHAIRAPLPAIDAVRARLAELRPVEFQFSDDLKALEDELVVAGHDRLAVRHACATLYLRGELQAARPVATTPVGTEEARAQHDRELALSVLSRRYTPAQLHAPGEALDGEASTDLLDVPMPGGRVVASGQGELKVKGVRRRLGDYIGNGRSCVKNPWYHLLGTPLVVDDWLDSLEQWASQSGKVFGPLDRGEVITRRVQVDWAELDSFCNLLKVNLAGAAGAGHWHEVGVRTYLVPLGSGICAQVVVDEGLHAKERLAVLASSTLAGLDAWGRGAEVVVVGWRPLPLISGDANCGPRVLNQVTFAAGKTYLTVTFHADPFTASAAQAWPAVVAKVKADAAAKELRDRYDDDD